MKNLKITHIKAGLIIHTSNQAYFLNVKTEYLNKKDNNEVKVRKKGMIEIKFQVGTSDLAIKKAYHCNNESLVTF